MDQDKDNDEEFSFDDDSFDFDEEEEETTHEEEVVEKATESESTEKKQPSSEPKEAPSPAPKTTLADATPLEKIAPDQLKLSVSVELGRVQVPLSTLINLQKGNLLDLGVRPEAGVDIIVQGKCIGKGELLKMGDTLGIRILDV